MKPNPTDGPGNDRANIIKLNPPTPHGSPPQEQGPPEIENRSRQAIAFILGEICDDKEDAEAALAALETDYRLFEERIAVLLADYCQRQTAADLREALQ